MTLNDFDLIALSEILSNSSIKDTCFAERLEGAIVKRVVALDERAARLMARRDEMDRARARVNDVTWYGGKRN